jgi:hypothetical protein
MAILDTKIMQLDKALSSYKDTKGELISFKIDSNNSDIYTGKGSDGFEYFIEIKKPNILRSKKSIRLI